MTGTRGIAIATAGAALWLSAAGWAQDPGLARCLAMADKEARLSCYDAVARADQGAAAAAKPRGGTAPAVAAVPSVVAAPIPAPRAEFGFGAAEREERRASTQKQLDEVAVRVTAAREVGAGYWQFEMDDGSLWRLSEVRAAYRVPRPQDEVRLLRASLGSYLLLFRNQPTLRIKRIR